MAGPLYSDGRESERLGPGRKILNDHGCEGTRRKAFRTGMVRESRRWAEFPRFLLWCWAREGLRQGRLAPRFRGTSFCVAEPVAREYARYRCRWRPGVRRSHER